MNVHLFGAALSPGVATPSSSANIKQQKLSERSLDDASDCLLGHFYMDDGLSSVPTSNISATFVAIVSFSFFQGPKIFDSLENEIVNSLSHLNLRHILLGLM